VSGIFPGDQILSVNGVSGDVGHIHGTPGTTVTLKLRRADEEITRDVDRVDERFILPYSVVSSNPFEASN
jgi:C-terminal processing protease CtpA/Prc